MLRTSPFSPPEPVEGLGARLPRPSEAAVPPSPPRQVRPGVFVASDGKMFTLLELPKPTSADIEMMRKDAKGRPTPWAFEDVVAEVYRKAFDSRRVPQVSDLIRVLVDNPIGSCYPAGFIGKVETLYESCFALAGAANGCRWLSTAANGRDWEFVS